MSSYLAIARKWRPQGFEDLIGQGHVVQTLKNAILLGRVSHAYLFCGARGIGKTSVARIFAKALRCPNVKDAVPCQTCAECTAIAEGRSVDVVEIDGASNNGVEAVRGIRDNVAYGAASGLQKIYIIDEVHMLSLSAFNALLKTLEEPPPHVIFILATTEVQKIPLTILSRCQRFEFRRLSHPQVMARLEQILKSEGIQISPEGLSTIASCADGSLRDALSLLDQVLSFFGEEGRKNPLNDAQVVEALGVAESDAVTSFWDFIIKKDIPGAVKIISDNFQAGIDLKHFAEKCLEELRLLYLIVLSKETGEKLTAESLDISPSKFGRLSEIGKEAKLITLERMAQIQGKAVSQLAWSTLPRFVLEMSVVRMAKLDDLAQVEAVLLRGEPLTAASEVAEAEESEPVEPSRPAQPQIDRPAPPIVNAPANIKMDRRTEGGPPSEGNWKGFVDHVMKKRPLLGALLSHANFRIEGKGKQRTVILEFAVGSFYERQATDTKNGEEILKFVKEYFGPDTTYHLSNGTVATEQSIESERNAKVAAIKKEALESSSVIEAQKVLGADIVGVRVEV